MLQYAVISAFKWIIQLAVRTEPFFLHMPTVMRREWALSLRRIQGLLQYYLLFLLLYHKNTHTSAVYD